MDGSSSIKIPFCKQAVENGMRKETNSFLWEIKNFDVVRKSADLIKLQRFHFIAGASVDFKSNWSFQLTLDINEEKEQSWINCGLFLTKAPETTKTVFASWQLKMKSTKYGAMKVPEFDTEVLQYGENGYEAGIFTQNEELNDLPLNNGSLILELTMHLYAPQPPPVLVKTSKDAVSTAERFKPKFLENLQSDLAKLLVPTCPLEGSTTVTKIVTADGVEFNAASNVLSLRSPVFKAMFESKMIETTTGIVRITDISSKTMTILLAFLYTGILLPDWRHPDVISELVYAAAKYQLPDLLRFLDEVVVNVCTKDNAGKLMNLAKKLSLEKAENDLWEFARKNVTSMDEMSAFIKAADGVIDFAATV